MGVLEYIKQKYQKTKLENCRHNNDECKCRCHTHQDMMHMFPCCGISICEKCDQQYNKIKSSTSTK